MWSGLGVESPGCRVALLLNGTGMGWPRCGMSPAGVAGWVVARVRATGRNNPKVRSKWPICTCQTKRDLTSSWPGIGPNTTAVSA
jgi:hypothetical protein